MAYSSTSMDQDIRTRLLSLQSSFFQSLQSGTDALAALCQELTVFDEAVRSCEPDLEDETCHLIYSFAQTCNAVIPGLIDLNIASEKVIQEEGDEFYKLLDRMMLDDVAFTGLETIPAYIQPAHIWLLDNLHNPYPSKQTRTTLSQKTNTPLKDLDSWFTDVRKRIGWNALRKNHFSSRKDMIAAATRFFKPSSTQLDQSSELEVTANFDQEFALLEDIAKNLYSRRFSTSALANGLEAVEDVTPEINLAGQGGSFAHQRPCQGIDSGSRHSSPEFDSLSPLTCSSPSPSPSPSPSQLPSQGRKRRQCTSDSNPSLEARPLKRMRVNVSANSTTPSPLPSTQHDTMQHQASLLDSSTTIPISESSRKRKRQSSDPSDPDSNSDQGRMKRAHCIPSKSLMEPLPSETSNLVDLNHWIKSLCGEGIDLGHSIPEPVYEASPLAGGLEIEFYGYASSSPSTSVSSLGPCTPPDYNTPDSPATSHQSWLESPSLTKAQGCDSLPDVTSTNWGESFLFDLNSPGILDAEFPSQDWDLGLTPAMSASNYSISQVLQGQEVVDESTQPWTNKESAPPISTPKPSNQLPPLISFSDNGENTGLPPIFHHPLLDKKGAKIRYLQTLLNEVQNVRLDLAL